MRNKLNLRTQKDAHPRPELTRHWKHSEEPDISAPWMPPNDTCNVPWKKRHTEDCISLYSASIEDMVTNRDVVLEEHSLKLKPSKCHFFKQKINYLEHT